MYKFSAYYVHFWRYCKGAQPVSIIVGPIVYCFFSGYASIISSFPIFALKSPINISRSFLGTFSHDFTNFW